MSAPLQFQLTLYPNPVLRKVAEPIQAFDAELAQTVRAMFDLMYSSKGVGLAAPQVGLRRRILVINDSGEPAQELALVNPTILERYGQASVYEEGCLSFPGIFAEVTRPERVRVRASDASGVETVREYEGFVARIVQHEYDHLEGVLLVDRMTAADRLRHKLALEELKYRHQRESAPGGVRSRAGG
jgi:peptide deformylase